VKVKITSVPPGGAPLKIRQQWVGLELPLVEGELEPGILLSVTGGKPDPRSFGGFPVKTTDAIAALHAAKKNEAARWWEAWHDNMLRTGCILIFASDCGEFVLDDEVAEAQPKKPVAAMTASSRRS